MNKFTRIASTGLAWLLAAGFTLGAWGNLFISSKATASYERWGYPSWFHYLTAACELTATILLLIPATRLVGATIGAVVMGTAVVTIIAAGESPHAIPAAVVLTVSIIVFVLTYRLRRARS
ncbi:DoxX family protein [Dyella sp. 2RAB6]|uniref:DoxX family protein n=1 Tax=Dyella sp. 2RAB6 TaxID=3232992 RepID=UPI003F9335AD